MLRVNKDLLIRDVHRMLDAEMNKVANVLIQYMIGEISQIPNSGSVDAVGKPDWRLDVIDALRYVSKSDANTILKDIGLINQNDDIVMKAMIINYGMGDLADVWTNPYISEYYSSQYYHKERGGMNVLGRKGKQVYDIDENEWFESTANHNKRIEHFHQIGSEFWSKYFGNSASLAESAYLKAIDNVFDRIQANFSKYLTYK